MIPDHVFYRLKYFYVLHPFGGWSLKSFPVASHGESFIPPSAANYFMRFFIRLKMASAKACINHTTIKNVIALHFIFGHKKSPVVFLLERGFA